jgi:flavin reductase (DIM6/NTAB) family NADH-FMN oxidoreductase RutF
MNETELQARAESFKAAAGRFASGVTIVSTRNGEHIYGITATSFVSLSLNPLLVTVSINSNSPILEEIRESGIFAISVLSSEQQPVSAYFSRRGRGKSKDSFEEVRTHVGQTGAPVVADALSWFDCRLQSMVAGGDHEILVGEVATAGGSDGEPLLYWSGNYRQLDATTESRDQAVSGRLDRFADAISIQLHMEGMSPGQLIEAQMAVEPAAAALAAAHASPEDVQRLQELIDVAREHEGEPDEYTREATDFHSEVGRLSGNPAIGASVRALSNPRRALYATGTSPATAARTSETHQSILDAIAAGRSELALELMASHLGTVSQGIC